LIEFLKSLEHEQDAELIINGDAFGLWDFTSLEGAEKLETLIEQQSRLFEQLACVEGIFCDVCPYGVRGSRYREGRPGKL
jgi:UDP-2,3-diacylglucosamine pyrophosphatase LpxH